MFIIVTIGKLIFYWKDKFFIFSSQHLTSFLMIDLHHQKPTKN